LPDAEASTDVWALDELVAAPLDVNIETAEQALARQHVGQSQRLRVALVVFGAGLILLVFQYLQYSEAATLANLGQGKWQRDINRLRTLRTAELDKGTALASLATTLNRSFKPAQTFSDVFTLASNAAPTGVWLTGMSLERGKVLTIRGVSMKGEAVVGYQTALVNEPRFRDVKLVFATNTLIENNPVVQFSISAFPVGNLPLTESTKKGAKR
jgi:hypothetical protein